MTEFPIVDAHQHFWDLESGLYPWLPPHNELLYRSYGAEELEPVLAEAGIASTVLVQASPVDGDTDAMLDHAGRHDWIGGVVGWVDPMRADATDRLISLASHPKFRGLRPSIRRETGQHWEPDPAELALLERAQEIGLSIDLLVRAHQLPDMALLADQFPTLPMVLDHGGGPDPASDQAAWRRDLERLARHPNIMCKISGLVTLAPSGAADAVIHSVIIDLLEIFGSDRLMWGSDWPILLQAESYAAWLDRAKEVLTGQVDVRALQRIFGENARDFYRIAAS